MNRAHAKELIRFALIAALIVIPFRLFIAQPFLVSGDSMVPTFHNGDYLIVDELSYRFRAPSRGDIVIFRSPVEPKKHLIKRIIGIPGDTTGSLMLGKDEYFVEGDNRAESFDSRYWGALSRKLITGRALLRLWPPTNIAWLPGVNTVINENQ